MVVELNFSWNGALLGNIVNTNAAFLAENGGAGACRVIIQTVVGMRSNRERLAGVMRTALEQSDILILTGGLGPTGQTDQGDCSGGMEQRGENGRSFPWSG